MSHTIVGLFNDIAEAGQTVKELTEGGVSNDDISLVAHRDKYSPSLGPMESISAGGGVGSGAAVGGAAGLTTGIVALAVPGIGPLIAAGPIAAELLAGGVGAAAGAVLGGLKQRGILEEDAGCYCEALRRGGILLSVTTSNDKAEDAERIIGQHRLLDIDDCAIEWRQSGWKGFDPGAEVAQESTPVTGLPFDPESIRPSVRADRRGRRAVRKYLTVG